MSRYHRNYVKGGVYFFTVVTYKRQSILNGIAIDILREGFRTCMTEKPFAIDAIVILPDHIHCIWTLPPDDADYSVRWKEIKGLFTKEYIRMIGEPKIKPFVSMMKKGEKGIWQRRFWEHTVRDEDDYKLHTDYIHYNPVKHGLAKSPAEWEYSSFHSFVKRGIYSKSWACTLEDFPEGFGNE